MGGTGGWPSCHRRSDQEQGVSLHARNRCGATGHAVHADRAIPGPHWTGSRPSIGHDVHVCGFPYPSQDQWLGLFHCRGLEQRSPICFYREHKLPASSFRVTRQAGPRLDWRARGNARPVGGACLTTYHPARMNLFMLLQTPAVMKTTGLGVGIEPRKPADGGRRPIGGHFWGYPGRAGLAP